MNTYAINSHIAKLNSIRKALIATFTRSQDDALVEAIDSIANAIQALGGTVAEVAGY